MSSKLKGWLFAGAVLLIIMLPIVIDYVANRGVDEISFTEFVALVDTGEFAVVYFGDPDASNFKETISNLKQLEKDYQITVRVVDTTNLSEEDYEEIGEIFEETSAYLFVNNGSVVHVNQGAASIEDLRIFVDRFYRGILLPEDISYKSVDSFDEFMEVVNSRTPAMFVIGTDQCPACRAFKPIFNDVAKEHEANIFYLNSDFLDEDEWDKIIEESKLVLPGSCRPDGEDLEMSKIPTVPTTIFTRRGRVIDCASGVIQRVELEARLRNAGIIK